MTAMKKVDMDNLQEVTGGQENVVYNPHKGYNFANCRKMPGLDQPVMVEVPNGTTILPTGRIVNKDGIDWYEVQVSEGSECGWMAASLIGY